MERIERRRSARLDRERLALEQQVEAEFELQQGGEDVVGVSSAGAAAALRKRRNSSVYLPVTHDSTRDNLRVAKHVIQVDLHALNVGIVLVC